MSNCRPGHRLPPTVGVLIVVFAIVAAIGMPSDRNIARLGGRLRSASPVGVNKGECTVAKNEAHALLAKLVRTIEDALDACHDIADTYEDIELSWNADRIRTRFASESGRAVIHSIKDTIDRLDDRDVVAVVAIVRTSIYSMQSELTKDMSLKLNRGSLWSLCEMMLYRLLNGLQVFEREATLGRPIV